MLFIFMLFLCLFHFFFICIMHSAFNLFVFPNYMFTSLLFFFFIFFIKGYELSGEIALKITIIIMSSYTGMEECKKNKNKH